MKSYRQVTELAPFPKNPMGLKRGSILEAVNPIENQLAVMIGKRVILGYDGEFVCCGPFKWSTEKIVQEIRNGIWKIIDETYELVTHEEMAEFALKIEHLELILPTAN